MGRSKRQRPEFRIYEIPQNEYVLALLGDSWRRVYGHDVRYLHFHNLMEVGICHEGRGVLTLDKRECAYTGGMISVIPANCPHHTLSEGENFWEYLFLDPAQLVRELYPNSKQLQEEKLGIIHENIKWLGQTGTARGVIPRYIFLIICSVISIFPLFWMRHATTVCRSGRSSLRSTCPS